jgi:DNA-binding LytR/AlgR family response regulator
MPIKCLLVDDEPLALNALEALIRKIPELEIAGKCSDAVEALQWIHKNSVDLVFLDIQMPEITGIGLLKSLSNPPSVIFTTAYREYAVEAFELDVVDYLVKPISLQRLMKTIDRYQERRKQTGATENGSKADPERTITIYSDKKTHKVPIREILYIQGLKDYALIYTQDKRLIARQTLKRFEEVLASDHFLRVHRSYIVPLHRVQSWTSYSLHVLQKEIPIGKNYRKEVLTVLESLST